MFYEFNLQQMRIDDGGHAQGIEHGATMCNHRRCCSAGTTLFTSMWFLNPSSNVIVVGVSRPEKIPNHCCDWRPQADATLLQRVYDEVQGENNSMMLLMNLLFILFCQQILQQPINSQPSLRQRVNNRPLTLQPASQLTLIAKRLQLTSWQNMIKSSDTVTSQSMKQASSYSIMGINNCRKMQLWDIASVFAVFAFSHSSQK